MAAPGAYPDDNSILAALALALVDHPRATLQELAKAIGISKATLYRFCRTREQLIERLMQHSTQSLKAAIQASALDQGSPQDALTRLINQHLEHRELTAFLTYYWQDATQGLATSGWEAQMDAFFLRGQQQGAFRIDISAPALTEIWVSMLIGMVDAERRGRVARNGLALLVESAFLNGTRPT